MNGVPAGDYSLIWLPLEGWDTPTPPQETRTLSSGGAVSFAGSYRRWTGRVQVDVAPEEIPAPWVLTGPEGTVQEGTGRALLDELPVGEYTLQWGEVDGWFSPDPQASTGAVERNQTVVWEGRYAPMPGEVRIVVTPDTLPAPWVLSGPDGLTTEGAGEASLSDLPTGDYTLTWGPLEGWDPPSTAEVTGTLDPGGELQFAGNYERWTGRVEIRVEPEEMPGQWTLTGPEGPARSGVGSSVYEAIPVGEYTLRWWHVDGWIAPQPSQVTGVVRRNETLVLEGRYERAVGELTVRVLPDGLAAPWVLTGPSGFEAEGEGTRTFTGLNTGPYRVVWGEVEGWTAPAFPTNRTLPPGGSVIMEGAYTASTGTVVVAVEPEESEGAWVLQGPDGTVDSGRGTRTFTGLPPAAYTLRWFATPGWEVPDPATVDFTLAAGATETIAGTFRAGSATLSIFFRPSAIPAPWRLTDPFGSVTTGEGTATLSGLQSGRYRMTWLDILGWTTPPTVEIEIAEGETASVQGSYPLMRDPYATNDSLSRVAALGGPLVPADDGTVLLETEVARLDEDGRSRFFGFTSDPGSAIAVRVDPLESFGHPLDAQSLGIRIWRQDSGGSGGWTLMGQLNLQPRGASEYHSPILYSGPGFAGDGTWAAEVYSAGTRTGRQLFRVRVSNAAIAP
ncbi:MAG: hypothetical protein EA422_12075 [Gemmatimonadales bacterium]|nr:MAG: hypothetical protein EA422_12075 [Gemmatimonadales bacterium]